MYVLSIETGVERGVAHPQEGQPNQTAQQVEG